LLVDIYNRAKKLHIDTEVKRVIFIIETSHEKDSAALDNVRNLLGSKSRDFVTAVDEKNIIVVKELSEKDGNKELEKMAKDMLDLLRSEGGDEQVHMERWSTTSRKFPSLIKKPSWRWMWARSSLARKISLPIQLLESAD